MPMLRLRPLLETERVHQGPALPPLGMVHLAGDSVEWRGTETGDLTNKLWNKNLSILQRSISASGVRCRVLEGMVEHTVPRSRITYDASWNALNVIITAPAVRIR